MATTPANGQGGGAGGEGDGGAGGGGAPPAGGEGGAPAGGAPSGGAPPAGGTPPPSGTPPHAAAKPPTGGKGGNGKPTPFDQHPGFRKRVRQEAERELRKTLGVSLEEAAKIIAKAKEPGGAPPAGAGGAPGTNTAAQEQAAQAALGEAELRIKKLKRKLKRARSASAAEMTAMEMKTDAIAVGVPEKYVRFALDVYRDLWRQASADPASVPEAVRAAFDKDPVDSRAVFLHIKAEHMPAAAPPPPPEEVSLDPSTSPPSSRGPGGEGPKPKPPGGEAPAGFDASKLSDADWRRHKRSMGIGG